MKVIDNSNVMNHYEKYKEYYDKWQPKDKKEFHNELKKLFICDDYLLNNYWKIITFN